MKKITKYDFICAINRVYKDRTTFYLQNLVSALNVIIIQRTIDGNYIFDLKESLKGQYFIIDDFKKEVKK